LVNFASVKEKVGLAEVKTLLGLTMLEGENNIGKRVWRGKCPVCSGGGPRSLVITEDVGFYCFASKTGGDQLALASHVKGIDVKSAAEFLNGSETPKSEPKTADQLTNGGMKPLDYLQAKHEKVQAIISEETALTMGVGYAAKGIMRGTVAVPVHDLSGVLQGYVGLENPLRVAQSVYKSQVIFNAHRVGDTVHLMPTVQDVLQLADQGLDGVCFLTETVQPEQMKMLAEWLFATNKVVVF